jgi:hypothetical protein
MGKNGKKWVIGILALALVAFFAGPALSGDAITITGTINEDGEFITDDGKTYDVVDTEKGDEVVEMVDKKVKATGTVEESEGKMMISITEYEVLE